MSVTEMAQRIITNNWDGIDEVDVRTFGYAWIVYEQYLKGK